MQYLCNQWSDFKNSWSCLILTLLWSQRYTCTMYPPHLNYATTLPHKTITMKITIFHRGIFLVNNCFSVSFLFWSFPGWFGSHKWGNLEIWGHVEQVICRPRALCIAKPTVWKHWRKCHSIITMICFNAGVYSISHRNSLGSTGWLKIKYPTRQYAISSQPVVRF